MQTRTKECERGRRGRQNIIMGILKTAKYGNKKTYIIDKVGLSSAQCTQYLKDLKGADYISEENKIWKTTEKGLQVIAACEICQNLMDLT